MTVEEAKIYITQNLKQGGKCPCCGQTVRLWRHTINGQMALCLIRVYQISKDNPNHEWVHILNEIKPSNRMYSLLRWWKLLEPKDFVGDEDKKSNGFWRITDEGKRFVLNQTTVKKYVHIFNDHLYGKSRSDVTIVSRLGKKFSYEELMSND